MVLFQHDTPADMIVQMRYTLGSNLVSFNEPGNGNSSLAPALHDARTLRNGVVFVLVQLV